MPVALAVPITTSGRRRTGPQAATAVSTARPPARLRSKRIFDALPLEFEEGLHPAPVAVVKHAAGIVGRDQVVPDRPHGALRRVDLLLAEHLGDQPDLAPVLDVDQPLLA